MNIIKISQVMYGDYLCSCGCGKPLGHPLVTKCFRCYGVGDDADEEGYEWRMFHPDCWAGIKDLPAEEIYDKYPIAPVNDAELEVTPLG